MSGMFGGLGLGESVGTFGECPRGVWARGMLVRLRAAVRDGRGDSAGEERESRGGGFRCMRCDCVLDSQTECETQTVSPAPGVLVACAARRG